MARSSLSSEEKRERAAGWPLRYDAIQCAAMRYLKVQVPRSSTGGRVRLHDASRSSKN
jgi:hypothetical protein